MLQALGFETEITASSFKILQWGFLVDDIVMALADLIDAYAVTNPALVSDVTEIAKTVYEIMCGERVSWDGTYGRGRAGS